MNNDSQQPPEQKPTQNIDDLIAQSTSQIYAFEHGKEKQSLKQRLLGLTKKQKLIMGGGVLGAILVITISLSIGTGTKQTLSSTQNASTATSVTTSTTSSESDTNGDGVIDEYDTTSTDTISSTGTSWWQKLLNINNSSGSSTSGDETDTASSDSTDSDDGNTDTASSANAEVAENEDVEQQTAASTTSSSSSTPTTTTTPTAPATPAQTTTPTTPTTKTAPTLSGVTNFRDASASSTKLMKSGVLYRSAKLQTATKQDAATLASLLKNGAIIDLRTTKVRKGAPDVSVSGVANLSYPIDAASSAKTYVSIFVNNASDRKKFGDVITKIANTKGSVLVHCTAGKDRTGWTVAMVMYAIGANDKQVMTEYLKSKEYGAKVDSAWLKSALSAAKKKNKGSIITYIKSKSAGLGVSDSTITKLKAKLSAK